MLTVRLTAVDLQGGVGDSVKTKISYKTVPPSFFGQKCAQALPSFFLSFFLFLRFFEPCFLYTVFIYSKQFASPHFSQNVSLEVLKTAPIQF